MIFAGTPVRIPEKYKEILLGKDVFYHPNDVCDFYRASHAGPGGERSALPADAGGLAGRLGCEQPGGRTRGMGNVGWKVWDGLGVVPFQQFL